MFTIPFLLRGYLVSFIGSLRNRTFILLSSSRDIFKPSSCSLYKNKTSAFYLKHFPFSLLLNFNPYSKHQKKSLQQKLQQANSGSYALQVMNQLTHHILQESNVKNPTEMATPR